MNAIMRMCSVTVVGAALWYVLLYDCIIMIVIVINTRDRNRLVIYDIIRTRVDMWIHTSIRILKTL